MEWKALVRFCVRIPSNELFWHHRAGTFKPVAHISGGIEQLELRSRGVKGAVKLREVVASLVTLL